MEGPAGVSRVAVIGAGFGGLSAAARLAAAGHQVRVYERTSVLGGKAGKLRMATAAGTVEFGTGPSLLTMPALVTDAFIASAGHVPAELGLRQLEPSLSYRFDDGTRLAASTDVPTMAERCDAAFGTGAGAGWEAMIGRGRRIWDVTAGSVLGRPIGPRGLARRATALRDIPAIAPGRSMAAAAGRYLGDARLRVLAERYATYTGSDPRRAPAALLSIPYVESEFGVWSVSGGIAGLVDALAAAVTDRGGHIVTTTPVEAIEHAGGRVRGVRTGGHVEPADVVVADVDAQHLYGDLLPSRAMLRRLARRTRSYSGVLLLLAVRGHSTGLTEHNVFLPADPATYHLEFDALAGRQPDPVAHPALYLHVSRDPALVPDGYEAWALLANAPAGDVAADSWAAAMRAGMARYGVDPAGRVVGEAIRTPADIATDSNSPGGAIYGSSSDGMRAAFLRPPNRTRLTGLFHVGGSAHPGGGLPLVALSARLVAEMIGPA